jgi:hypothetical protein
MSTSKLELIGKFIGPDEITESSVTELKTPNGAPIIEVTFKNGKKRRYTQTALDFMLTDALSDYTTVSDKRLNKIAEEVVSLVREYDVTVGDIDRLMQKIAMGIENKFNEATSFMWFKSANEYTVGFNPMYDVSLNMAQEVIDNKPHEGE